MLQFAAERHETMTAPKSTPTSVLSRRELLRHTAAMAALATLPIQSHSTPKENTMTTTNAPQQDSQQTTDTKAIRPFQVKVPQAQLTDLRQRINATRWPERETVADQSQGVPLATMQALARYWATDYDW